MRIGIPRGLLYYQYFPMWKTFFEALGAEVVVSPQTTQEMLDQGCSRAVGDICLPVKVFCGHALSLAGKCDYVFIPSIHSPRRGVYNCPKFIGLPDIVRATAPECPSILDPDIDANEGRKQLDEVSYKLGSMFTQDGQKIENALNKALEANQAYRTHMERNGLTPVQSIEAMFPEYRVDTRGNGSASVITVAVIGHRYLLYDEHISHRLVHRLTQLGVKTVYAEMAGEDKLRASMLELVDKPYWGYEEEIVGAGAHYILSDADGIISVAAFGCGPDSVMLELVQRAARRLNKPFLKLILDEHTGEGGLITRLEAFVDMVRRTKRPAVKSVHLARPLPEEQDWIGGLGLPNMRTIAPALKTSARMVGLNLIVPPVTKNTLSLGTRYSPEFVCLPFKVILGCFIECLQAGADTLFMVTSSNACRMGYYSKVHEEILRDLGYQFRFLRHRSSDKGLAGVLRTIRRCTNHAPWLNVVNAYRLATAKLKALDDLERKIVKVRPVARDKSNTELVFKEAIDAIEKAEGHFSLRKVMHTYLRKLDELPRDPLIVPLKVGIVGEMYVVLEPFCNLNLEVELGKLGVEVMRTKATYLSEWTSIKSYMGVLNSEKRRMAKYAYPYLKRDVGGHGLESVAEKVRLARDGYDGVVHLTPFTCMPETIAQNIMPTTKEKIPVLTLICDEQATKTGVLTRLEAFVDLLERRRRSNYGKQPVAIAHAPAAPRMKI
jgi:predicted nucleotide-binding protein (sugar kinase/HSP70/actin superfamily)